MKRFSLAPPDGNAGSSSNLSYPAGDGGEVRICRFSNKEHTKVIITDLRIIRDTDVKRDGRLVAEDVGKYWCRHCRTKIQSNSAAIAPPLPQSSSRCTAGHSSADNTESSSGETTAGVEKFCMFSDSRHKKKITKDLRIITENNCKANPTLVEGLYWCSSCRKNKNQENVSALESQDETNQPASISTSEPGEEHTTMRKPSERTQPAEKTSSQEKASRDDENISDWDLNVISSVQPDVVYNTANVETAGDGQECIFIELGSCMEHFITVKDLKANELKALSWNSGEWRLQGNSSVCKFHYEEFVGKYKRGTPTIQNSCCDPLKIHMKKIKKNLRRVMVDLVSIAKEKNMDLVYGNTICNNCYRDVVNYDTTEASPSVSREPSSSSSSTLLSPAVIKEQAKDTLLKLGITVSKPPRYITGRVEYGKKKLEEGIEKIKKQLSRLLNVDPNQLLPDVYQKAEEMDSLMKDVKNKLPTASKNEKYQLLTLLPLSMSITEASQIFNVSDTLIGRSRALKIERGILATPQFSRVSTVLDTTKAQVVKFYCEDENSKVLPGRKDCVSVSKNVYEQKRLLLLTLGELHAVFKKKYLDLKVGRSMFFSLRPKWCVFPRSSGTHIVCVCQIHEDFKLILGALKIKVHYRDLIAALTCDTNSRSCMLRLCDQCPSNPLIFDYLQKLVLESMEFAENFTEENEFLEEEIRYQQWKSTDRSELVDLIVTRSDLLNIAVNKLVQLIPHDFIAQRQAQYVREFKENMPATEIKILMDFAMNFSCTYHRETQSYHFSKTQVTLHPVVLFHKPEDAQEVKTESICFVSNDLSHDVALVKTFQEKTISIVKAKYPNISDVEYITDGSGSQYKNKFSFYNLCQHEKEFGLKARHSFFATSHGKALCDAMAGNIKRLLTDKSLQRLENNPINSAQKVYEFLKSHDISAKINFIFISTEEADIERNIQLPKDQLLTIPSTRTFHCFVPLSENTIGCKRLTSDERFSLVHCLVKQPEQVQPEPSYEAGTYVVLKAAGRRHIAFLSDINQEEQEAEVATLQPRMPSSTGVYKWRESLETFIVPLPHILCSVELTELENNSFKFSDSDITRLRAMRVLK